MKALLFVDQHVVGHNLKCFYFKMIYINFYELPINITICE